LRFLEIGPIYARLQLNGEAETWPASCCHTD
jgi:hypothetical protein